MKSYADFRKHLACDLFSLGGAAFDQFAMPSLAEQIQIEDAFTAPYSVARALLRPGRAYDQSVAMFSPYREIKDAYPEGRESLRQMIRTSMDRARSLYIHINNRLEGNAIETIRAITE